MERWNDSINSPLSTSLLAATGSGTFLKVNMRIHCVTWKKLLNRKARIYWHSALFYIPPILSALTVFLLFKHVLNVNCDLFLHISSQGIGVFCVSGPCVIEMSTEWTTLQAKPENSLNSLLSSVEMPSEYLSDLPRTWQMYRWATETESNAEFHTAWTGKKGKANIFKDCASKETVFWVNMREKNRGRDGELLEREEFLIFCLKKEK